MIGGGSNRGKLTITKIDADNNNIKLDGAEFVISTDQKKTTSNLNGQTVWETKNGGIAEISDLKPDTTYYIYESKAPEGYNLSDQGKKEDGLGVYIGRLYVIPEGGTASWTVTNKKKPPEPRGSLTIIKVDADSKDKNGDYTKKLSGAEFVISTNRKTKASNLNGNTMWTTKSDGSTTISDLKADTTYYIYEKTAPSGYDLSSQGSIIDGLGVYIGSLYVKPEGGTATWTVTNKKSGKIKIKKVDQEGNPVSGISFDLIEGEYTGDGGRYTGVAGDRIYVGLDNKLKTGTTDSNGELVFDNLAFGTYTIRETWSTQESFKRNIGQTVKRTVTSSNPNYYYNNPITIKNTYFGGLTLDAKVDKYTGQPLSGVGFRLYQGDVSKYRLGETDANGKTSSSSSFGGNSSITLKNAYGIEVDTMYTIEPGEYDLYEYKNPNEGYNIRYQGQYYVKGKGAYIGKVTIAPGQITNIANLTYTYKNENTGKNETVKYNINEKFASIYLHKYIEELNSEGAVIRKPLAGAKFKLYQNDQVVKLKNVTDTGYTDIFESILSENGEDAKVTIERIPAGEYYVYEVPSFDKNGNELVDLTIQPGYDPSKNEVKIAEVTITQDGEVNVVMVNDLKKLMGTDNKEHYYRGYSKVTMKEGAETKVGLYITNRRYIQVSGYVWEDIGPDTKTPGNGNNKYKEKNTEKDKKISGIKVYLFKKGSSSEFIKETETDSNGNYKFTTLIPSLELKKENYYLEFDYSGYVAQNRDEYDSREKYLYMPVDSIFDKTNGSKALTQGMLNKDDNYTFSNIGVNKAYTGYGDGQVGDAITNIYNQFKENKLKVSDWIKYDTGDSIPTLHYINLGIRQLVHPEFSIEQTIDHATLTVNGYKYTYTYNQDGDINNYDPNDTTKPTVRWQSETDISSYCLREIYPSDLPQNGVNTELQIVYKIDITNNTDINIVSLYKENAMFVNSLTNTYDANRYTLIPETVVERTENNNQITETYKWKQGNIQKDDENNISQGTTTLDMTATTTFKDGIKPKERKTVYITFKVNEDAFKDLLEHPNGIVEDYPTNATASVYHEYTRYDYSWKNPKENDGEVKSSWDTWYNKKGRKHKSVIDTRSDTAPYLALKLHGTNEQRTISGTVFKDNNTRSSTKEVVGDGVYNSEENTVSGVKVELVESGKHNKARCRILQEKENSNEKEIINTEGLVYTDKNGKYSFVGVAPGEYYIRFTYGDGSQKITDLNGNEIENGEIYSNGYKSTIVSNQGTQLAYNNIGPDNNPISSQKGYIWYLYIKNKECNTAVDNEINSNDGNANGIPDCFEYDYQVDFRTQNNDSSVKSSKTADTPLISVPIEFITSKKGTATTSYSSFDNMSFGIIEKPKVTMKLKKEITNIKLTYNNGQELFNGNPSSNIPYVSNFDNPLTDSGSRNVKVEANNSNIYGATLEVIYTITVENESDLTYITEDYYKYGTVPMLQNNKIDESKEAKIYVNSVLEYLDPLLKIKLASNINNNNGEEYTYNDNKKIEVSSDAKYEAARDTLAEKESSNNKEKEAALKSKYKEVYELGKMDKQYMINNGSPLRTTKVSNEESETSTKLQVVATRILSNENDELDYISYAQLSTVTTAKNAYSDPTAAPLVEVEGGDYWNTGTIPPPYKKIPGDSTDVTITPATGLNKNMDYYIAGIIVLITLGAVVVCVKKIIK